MNSITIILYILIDLNRMIKNEWLRSIVIMLLSAFALVNAKDPNASVMTKAAKRGATSIHQKYGSPISHS
jgi:hypothetical protein